MTAHIASIPWWHFRERRQALEDFERGLKEFNAQLDRTLESLPSASAEDLEREVVSAFVEHRTDLGEPI